MNKLTNKLNSQKGQSGFTIIEVLIVLAIAGLILVAVLLAVPALQRNQRNTTYKNNANAAAAAVNEFKSNNSGSNPAVATSSTELIALAKFNGTVAVSVLAALSGTYTQPTATSGKIAIYNDMGCSNNDLSNSNTTGKNAVIYGIENGDGSISRRCIEV